MNVKITIMELWDDGIIQENSRIVLFSSIYQCSIIPFFLVFLLYLSFGFNLKFEL